jgi:hypothetical protein
VGEEGGGGGGGEGGGEREEEKEEERGREYIYLSPRARGAGRWSRGT